MQPGPDIGQHPRRSGSAKPPALARIADREAHVWRRSVEVVRGIAPFCRRHRGLFGMGALAAAGVVAARIALPWPLRAITDFLAAVPKPADGTTTAAAVLDLDPVLAMGGLFFGLLLMLGLCDFLERLYFSRFAIRSMRDLRAAVFKQSLGIEVASRKAAAGDIVSRLIGDTARVKVGLQGFLVHVATNSLVFLGVTVILFTMDVRFGLIFAAAALMTAAVTVWGARRIFVASLKHREKEGKLANKIHRSMGAGVDRKALKRINKSSSRAEATQTRRQGQITWATHGIFGLAALAALWSGAGAVTSGSLSGGDLVLFMMYALMMRGPIVRLARQGTRTGKILGPGYRLVRMLDTATVQSEQSPAIRLKPLKKAIRVDGLRVATAEVDTALGPIDLMIEPGERIALLSDDLPQATRLLEVLAGHRPAEAGIVSWDGIAIRGANVAALREQVELLEPPAPGPSAAAGRTLLEQQLLRLAALMHRPQSLRLLLQPGVGLDAAARACLMEALAQPPQQRRKAPSLVISTDRSADARHFDRIVHLRDGRIVYDGPAANWREESDSTLNEGGAGPRAAPIPRSR